jgi:gamma-glutamyltranspeptidase/glutathione hydrolase
MTSGRGLIVLSLLLCGLAACIYSQQREKERERPLRNATRGVRAAITAGTEPSAEAGMRLLNRGGNAVDAGVAAMYAATLSEFSHLGFGGEVSMLVRTKEGKVFAIAGIGTMPKAGTAEFFRTRRLVPGEIMMIEPGGLKGMIPVAGLMPALVPGIPEAGLVALRDFGTLSVAHVLAPAAELAEGMVIDEMRANVIQWSRRFFDLWPASKAVFLPGDRPPAIGEVFRQSDLARTMRAMIDVEKQALRSGASRTKAIDAVRDYFYRGDIARRIDAFVRQNDGLLRYDDMAAFRIQPEPAVCTDYRGFQVCKSGFWSQGPVTVETLNMLEGVDLKALGHNSPEYVHTFVETLKLVFADRDTYYADPRMATVPPQLMTKEYAAHRRAEIGRQASMDFRPGSFPNVHGLHPSDSRGQMAHIDQELKTRDTTGINAVDKDGVMFSATPSGAALPAVIAGDTGIPLTQRAQSFFLIEGHPNEVAGGKRPRITLSPTLVTRNGRPFMTLATPGGDNQDQALLQILLNVIEFGMNAQQAIEAPRFQTRHLVSSFDNHAMFRGDLLLDERIPAAAFGELAGRGHKVSIRSRWNSGAHPVAIRVLSNGVLEAGVDPYGYRVAHAW